MLHSSNYQSIRNNFEAGFTLLEMMVSIGIMLVISSVVLFNQSHYSSGASLRNLADSISLEVRQAQVYGTSVQGFIPQTGSTEFTNAYGVHFSILASDPTSKTSYTLFADRSQSGAPRNQVYDYGATCPKIASTPDTECIERVTINNGNKIQDLCLIQTDGSIRCSDVLPIGAVDITFLRPDTQATITFIGNDLFPGAKLSYCAASACKGVRIKLVSPDNATSSVDVYTTGQISVQ